MPLILTWLSDSLQQSATIADTSIPDVFDIYFQHNTHMNHWTTKFWIAAGVGGRTQSKRHFSPIWFLLVVSMDILVSYPPLPSI